MKTVAARISTKYQVVIPKAVREALDLQPRERLLFLLDGDTVILCPEPASFAEAMCGLHGDLWPDPDE